MSFLQRILACRRCDPAVFRPLRIDGHVHGWISTAFVNELRRFPDVFHVEEDSVSVHDRLAGFEVRTEALGRVVRRLADEGVIDDWRGEDFAVTRRWGEEPVARIDRSAVVRLGTPAFGVHVNGYVHGPEGLRVWVGRRARDAHTAPGALDHVVAGGQPHGLSLEENLAKECDEEAAIPLALAATAVPTGLFSYRLETSRGLKNDTVFAYDLELPADFVPRNRDGEVEAFALWPVDRLLEALDGEEDFKFNVAPVILAFLVRRGVLGPDHPDYVEILRALGEVPTPDRL